MTSFLTCTHITTNQGISIPKTKDNITNFFIKKISETSEI